MILVGYSGYNLFFDDTCLSSTFIDEHITSIIGAELARLLFVCTMIVSLVFGGLVYARMTRTEIHSTHDEKKISRKLVSRIIIFDAIFIVVSILLYAFSDSGFGRIMSSLLTAAFLSIRIPSSIGLSLEYLTFPSKSQSLGAKIAVYVSYLGTDSSLVRKLTSPFGGFLYMTADRRVEHVIMRREPLSQLRIRPDTVYQ